MSITFLKAQTVGKTIKNNGMFHFEGGWPKEINPRDEETTARFRRRVEKEDDWAPRMRLLFSRAENCIFQNSAINVYDHFFDDMIPTELVRPRYLRTLNVYADTNPNPRPVNNISWSPDSVAKIAVTYCYTEFGKAEDYNFVSYIWEIVKTPHVENSNQPWAVLEPFSPAVVTEFNPRDPSILASGLMTGQVCSWDIRTGNLPVQESHPQFSHRSPTSCLKWTMSKSNSEFFTGSSEGRIMWWDIRKLREPTETLIINLDNTKEPNVESAIGVTSLNYEPSMGTKFLFGTENGVIISGSRKSKTTADKLALRFHGHYGPIYNVDRNPFNPKYILTVGDWTSRIWAEDTKEGNLVATRFCKEFPTGGCWSKSRYSIFYVTNRRGELEAWDLLVGLNNPVVIMQLSEDRLTTIAPHEEGTWVAVGDLSGNVYLVEASASLISFEKNDRVNLTSYLDRCSRYMKAIDARLREIKLMKKDDLGEKPDDEEIEKHRIGDKPKREEQSSKVKYVEKDSDLEKAEDQYFKVIQSEKEKYESVQLVDSTEVKILKVSTNLDVKADRKKIDNSIKKEAKEDNKKKNGKGGKNKAEGEEIVVIRRKKKTQESTEVSQKIIQDAEITEMLEKEIKSPKMNEELVVGTAAKISRKVLRTTKRPRTVILKFAKPCDSICNVKVCCKDIINAKEQKRNKGQKTADKCISLTRAQNELERIETSEKSRKEKIDWSSIKKSPSTDLLLPKIALLGKQEMKKEITITLDMLSLSEKPVKQSNVQDTAKVYFAESLDSKTKNEFSDEEDLKEFLGRKNDEEFITRKQRMIPVDDKCSPQMPLPTLLSHTESFVKGPARALQEPRLQEPPVKRYKEEVEAARGRIYPRISAFHEFPPTFPPPRASLQTDPDHVHHQTD